MCNMTLYIIRASAGNVVNPSDFNQQAIEGVLMLHSINVSAAITLSVRHRQHNGAVSV